mmetsp:Transcript_4041/g.16168  ORF Transcript_4041/g.16168 Transcript_4041/m.16168 type:complete len:405 (+) Transcript_4041:1935-3149(+)
MSRKVRTERLVSWRPLYEAALLSKTTGYRSHGSPSPTQRLNTFAPSAEDTAMFAKPRFAAPAAATTFGNDVPTAPTVRPTTLGSTPRSCAPRSSTQTIAYDRATNHTTLETHAAPGRSRGSLGKVTASASLTGNTRMCAAASTVGPQYDEVSASLVEEEGASLLAPFVPSGHARSSGPLLWRRAPSASSLQRVSASTNCRLQRSHESSSTTASAQSTASETSSSSAHERRTAETGVASSSLTSRGGALESSSGPRTAGPTTSSRHRVAPPYHAAFFLRDALAAMSGRFSGGVRRRLSASSSSSSSSSGHALALASPPSGFVAFRLSGASSASSSAPDDVASAPTSHAKARCPIVVQASTYSTYHPASGAVVAVRNRTTAPTASSVEPSRSTSETASTSAARAPT